MRILFIDIDALRADHLGCYGYHRATSPNIDQVAKNGVQFNKYYCSDAPCLPSRTALYSGKFGIHSGVVGHGGSAADLRLQGPDRGFRDRVELESLPSRLQNEGFYTAQISPFAQRHAARHFYAGFHEMHNTGKGGRDLATDVFPVVERWLKTHAKRDNWYLHLNFWDTHTPIELPLSYQNPFAYEKLPNWLTEEKLAFHRQYSGPHGARDLGMFSNVPNSIYPRPIGELETMQDLRDWIDGYDASIRYIDDHIGRILKLLEFYGVRDETAVIITADHGENQGELGLYGEHATADQVTCRVPMIVSLPGAHFKGVDDELHYQIDFAPTLSELLGFSPSKSWDGNSYAKTLRDGTSCGRPFLVLSQCAHVCQRSVRFDKWIYIRTYHDGFHPFPKEMLFDVENDPHEQRNVAEEFRDVCNQALRYLHDWHDEMMGSMPFDVDPMWTVIHEGGPFHIKGKLDEFCQRLERSNRSEAAGLLRRRHH